MNNTNISPPIAPPPSSRLAAASGEAAVNQNRSSRRHSLWFTRLIYLTVASLAGCGLLLIATLLFGEVSGTEFSPDSLETRTFRYHEIPGIRWQVTPVKRNVTLGGVERWIGSQNLIPPRPSPRWDLVAAERWNEQLDPRGASILVAYFRARYDAGSSRREYWGDWTVAHPSLAKVLWPEVIQLARRGLYLMIPDVMELARRAAHPTDPEDQLLPGRLFPGRLPEDGMPEEGTQREGVRKETEYALLVADVFRQRLSLVLEQHCHELAEIHDELGNEAFSERLRHWADQYALRGELHDEPRVIDQPDG